MSKDKQIQKLIESERVLKKLNRRIEEIQKDFKKKNNRLNALGRKLDKEEVKVKSLERGGLGKAFSKILGKHEERLEKTKQDHIDAYVEYTQLEKELRLINYELEVLTKKANKVIVSPKELDKLLKEKERSILRMNNKYSGKLILLERKNREYQSLIKELKEALAMSKKVITGLTNLLRALKGITKWGRHHGPFLMYEQKKLLRKASNDVVKVYRKLQQLESEMRDIYRDFRLDYRKSIENYQGFLNSFSRGLINDWLIQKRIHHTANSVHALLDDVQRLNQMLTQEHEKVKNEMNEIKMEKKRIILSASTN